MVGAFLSKLFGNSNKPSQAFSGVNAPKVVAVSNAQSWDSQTHPEGIGDSQLVQDIDYKDGVLDVTYRDGYTARYSDVPPEEAKAFSQAPSKGRWALKNLWNKPYVGV